MKRPVLQTAISLRKSSTSSVATCYDVDRDRCVLDKLGNAYLGFTASTGGERAKGRSYNGDSAGTWNHQTYDEYNPQTDPYWSGYSPALTATEIHNLQAA